MNENQQDEEIVIPGDVVGQGGSDGCECGIGCYLSNNNQIIATLCGKVIYDQIITTSTKTRVNVISTKSIHSHDVVIDIGDIVLARVIKLTINQVIVEILSVGDRCLRLPSRGIVRKEDIRLHDIDTIIIHECYRPGDIIRATIISLGDTKQYFLSTAESEFGVRWCKSEKSGQPLIPLNHKEMEDPITKTIEFRKVAKPT